MAKMETLQDNFDFGGIDPGKWTATNSQVVIGTNLDLEMSSILGGNYVALQSITTYDLTSSYAYCQVTNAGNQSITSWEVYPVYLFADANNKVFIRIATNTVQPIHVIAGVTTNVGTGVTYNSSTMKYFRIRESSGTTYYEYASDPTSTWTVITSEANPITLTALTAEVLVGTWQAETSTTTAYLDNFNTYPTQYQFTWSGYTWNQRIHQGNVTGQTWSPSNISGPDSNGYLTLNLTNPGSAPVGCEIFSVQRGFGYGVFTCVVATELDNPSGAVDFGGMFTFDFTSPPDYKEIDMEEIRFYNGLPNRQILYNHAWNNGGSISWVTNYTQMTSASIHTHQCIWTPTRIVFRSYAGAGAGGTLINYAQHETNVPVPGLERVHFNIYVDPTISGYASTPALGVVIRSFTFDKKSEPGNVGRHLVVEDGMSRGGAAT